METPELNVARIRAIAAVAITLIVCGTIVLFRAISLPVALERNAGRFERAIEKIEMREAKHEGRQDTKQERIEQKAP